MSVVGVLSGPAGQAGDGVAVDADEATGLPGAVALGEVVQHRAGLALGEVRAEQRSALALGEAIPAGLAVEEANVVVLAEVAADGEVAGVAVPVECAVGVLAAEASEVVHGSERTGLCPGVVTRRWNGSLSIVLRPPPGQGSIVTGHHHAEHPA
jgi:hypothetical protein